MSVMYVTTYLLEAHFPLGNAQYASFAFVMANFIASVMGMSVVER